MEAWGGGYVGGMVPNCSSGADDFVGRGALLEIYPGKPLTPSIMELYGHQVPSDLFCAISTRGTTKSGPFPQRVAYFIFVHTKV